MGRDFLSDYIAPKAARPTPHPLPEGIDGVVSMCEAASTPAHAALFALQGLMGLRVSEARSVHASHFDLVDMTLKVRGKGDKERVVPVTSKAWKFIEPAFQAASFTGGYVVPIADGTAREVIRTAGRRLGFMRDISSHDLRATCATAMLERSGNLRAVQEMLGHANITTTQIYTQIKMDTIREGMEF